MHLNIYIYGCIWPYIPIYAVFGCLWGMQDTFTMYSHPESWCALYQADTAILQCHVTSMQKAVIPAQLSCHMVIQLNKHLYKWLNKLNLSMCINSISLGSTLLLCRSTFRPIGKVSGRYARELILLPIYTDPEGRLDMLWVCSNGLNLCLDTFTIVDNVTSIQLASCGLRKLT